MNIKQNYKIQSELDHNEHNDIIHELIKLVKEKGLTIRQAHDIFINCADTVLDMPVSNYVQEIDIKINDEIDKFLDILLNEIKERKPLIATC